MRTGAMATSSLTGVVALTRLALRRDRKLAGLGVGALVLMCYVSALATPLAYQNEADRIHAAQVINSSGATVALYGPLLDPSSIGEFSMAKMTVVYALFAGLLMVALVRRNTRADEERGLAELVGAAAIGRSAAFAAAVLESAIAGSALGIGAIIANIAGGLPVVGSITFGAMWGASALVAAAVAAVCVQVSENSRNCGAIAIGILLGWFAIRAYGDVSWRPLSWLSPYGWNTQLSSWVHPRLWVFTLYGALVAGLLVLAAALRARRDLGAGLFTDRPRPARGGHTLGSVWAITWRTNRTTIAMWSVAVTLMGAVMGAIAPLAKDLLEGAAADALRTFGGGGALSDALLAAEFSIAAVAVSCFAIGVVAQAAAQEAAGLAEQLRSANVPRLRTWLAPAGLAAAGSFWLLGLTGIAASVGARESLGVALGALAYVPAVWVILAAGLVAFGLSARYAAAGWAIIAGSFVVRQVAELLQLPSWVAALSPFKHVPLVPSQAWSWPPEIGLLAVAVSLALLGAWLYRRRDLG